MSGRVPWFADVSVRWFWRPRRAWRFGPWRNISPVSPVAWGFDVGPVLLLRKKPTGIITALENLAAAADSQATPSKP